MPPRRSRSDAPAFARWLPLARQLTRTTVPLAEKDVVEIYTYPGALPLAEAVAFEARRRGSDTHITMMTDDLWFASMDALPRTWLEGASPAEQALAAVKTVDFYIGGLSDGPRLQRLPWARVVANSVGGAKTDAAARKRRVPEIVVPSGWVSPQRAEAYGLHFARWRTAYETALGADLRALGRAGTRWARQFAEPRDVHLRADGTDLRFATAGDPFVDDGILDAADRARGVDATLLPAGRVIVPVKRGSAHGVVRFRDPIYLRAFAIRDVEMHFERGALVSWKARASKKILSSVLAGWKPRELRLGWMTIGVNALAKPAMMDNGIVDGAIAVGLGTYPLLAPGSSPFGAVGAVIGEIERGVELAIAR